MSRLLNLTPEQVAGVDPARHAWVSASAGTGKTQVLTARILRLLAEGAAPSGILALTFTKAAAAEMQTRLFERLAGWVLADAGDVTADLRAIGAAPDEAMVRRARTLFARTLEVRGGFKLQTIHSFASTLLAAFPLEAAITPGYALLDERTSAQIRQTVLEDAIADAAEDGGDGEGLLADLGALAVRHGDAGAVELLNALLAHRELLLGYPTEEGLRTALRRAVGLPGEGGENELLRAAITAEPGLADALADLRAALATSSAQSAANIQAGITAFFALDEAPRLRIEALRGALLTKTTGKVRKLKAAQAELDAVEPFVERLGDALLAVDAVEAALLHLRTARVIAERYTAMKGRLGAVDFDDLIAGAAALLGGDMRISADWVRYKLDQRIDHVLVDEGQDTNRAQWQIVEALTGEFFAGDGAADGARSLFAVGDFKQAIYGFQGTDPEEFRKARDTARAKAEAACSPLAEVGLNTSFRSVPAVLAVVDKLLESVGAEALGLDQPLQSHMPHRKGQAGAVTLLPTLGSEGAPFDEEIAEADYPERAFAQRTARQVRDWLSRELFVPSKKRGAQAQDILILVRKRGDLVPELVAALHKEGVPVAGADRLRLTAPLAVRDCLSLIRFTLQPNDDLSLAELLTSPLLGWSQQELYDLAHPRAEGVTLWSALRRRHHSRAGEALDWLNAVLAITDFSAPFEFLEQVLSGPLGGRSKLLARLGDEARDPLEELLVQALVYERTGAPTLQGFLDWLGAADDVDIKRDAEAPAAAVRIMTVHGAKGLQAPVVFLADAARKPGGGRSRILMSDHPELPWAGLKQGDLPDRLRTAHERSAQKDMQEDLRLLYVAMTRAEDFLFVGGIETKRGQEASWHDRVAATLADMETEEERSDIWGGMLIRHKSGTEAGEKGKQYADSAEPVTPPPWALSPAPAEQKPPRPLAPSEPDADGGLPPPGPQLERAAERGRLMHRLFEVLPELPAENRRGAARTYLKKRCQAIDVDTVLEEVFAVMDNPDHAALFSPHALREAPITAVVNDRVIAGTVDVLVVEEDRVLLVDYKTDRAVPENAANVREKHRNQMAAYRGAAAKIFPAHSIETGLLYTAGPRLIWLAE
ncbi:MAG: double-strand break repair helicase AddA [Pacificimonas sp.]|nr:double-strand break repair helicase AddA [Pacificimonas sp.]